jgi:hypothetical protein
LLTKHRAASPEAAPTTSPSPADSRRSRTSAFVPLRAVLIGLVPIFAIVAWGMPYYTAPLTERLRSSYHEWLKPSGVIGLAAGFLAFALFAFLWLYPLRKRLGKARWLGPIPKWLDVHIFAGVMVPIVAALHAGFRFTGIIGLGYFAMLVVAFSGIFGRYLYQRIPRSRTGIELGREQVSSERREILGSLVESTGLDPRHLTELLQPVRMNKRFGILGTLFQMMRDDFERRRAIRRVLRALKQQPGGSNPAQLKRIRELARRELALGQQLRLLEGTQRIFGMWHAFHLPFAVTAFIAVAIHVTVAIVFGVTWFGG